MKTIYTKSEWMEIPRLIKKKIGFLKETRTDIGEKKKPNVLFKCTAARCSTFSRIIHTRRVFSDLLKWPITFVSTRFPVSILSPWLQWPARGCYTNAIKFPLKILEDPQGRLVDAKMADTVVLKIAEKFLFSSSEFEFYRKRIILVNAPYIDTKLDKNSISC